METQSLNLQVQPYKLACACIPTQVNGISNLGAGDGASSPVAYELSGRGRDNLKKKNKIFFGEESWKIYLLHDPI